MPTLPVTPLAYTASAALYGIIPLVYLLFPGGAALALSILVTVCMSAICLPGFAVPRWRESVRWVARQPRLILLGLTNPLCLMAYFGLMFVAIQGGDPKTAVVLVETWPLMQALLMGVVMAGRFDRLGLRDLVAGAAAILGLLYISQGSLETTLLSMICGLGAALSMALSSTVKTRFVIEVGEGRGAGPAEAFFLVKVAGMPASLLCLAGLFLLPGGLTGVSPMGPVLVALLSVLATVLANLGNLHMRHPASLYLFLLTPVFGILFTGVADGYDIPLLGICGIIVLLAVNALCMMPRPADPEEVAR